MLDLVEITPRKLNIKKIIITVIIIILIIAMCVLGVIAYKKTKKDKLNNTENIIESKIMQKEKAYTHVIEFEEPKKQTQDIREQISNIYHSDTKRVFLTFDDGPSKTVTPLILDLLKQENIKATFFLLGSRAELNPDIVKREYDEGHYIANHGYSHNYTNIYQTPQSVVDEFNATEVAIKNALGNQEYNSYLFRFPGGMPGGKHAQLKAEAAQILEQNGVAHLDWNALTSDAAGAKTSEEMLQNAISTIGEKNSVVILMHDAGDKILTYEMLPNLISYLREKGYEFKNMYDLIE
jgi:peptidoglycan/xylan/chitin deacetylase (PgdA/CDA1 family)